MDSVTCIGTFASVEAEVSSENVWLLEDSDKYSVTVEATSVEVEIIFIGEVSASSMATVTSGNCCTGSYCFVYFPAN